MSRPPPPPHELAQLAYAAYGAATGGRNFRGDPMPDWDDLGHAIQHAWIAAAGAVQRAHLDVVLVVDLDPIHRQLERIERVQSQLVRKAGLIMGKQEDLDAIVTRIDTAVAGIRQDIADLKADHPEVDFSALEERVAGLESLDAENPAPASPPQE